MIVRPIVALLLVGMLATGTAVAQQGQVPDRTLPGDRDLSERSDRVRALNNRNLDRELPSLQDRDNVGEAPPALRDRFAEFCKTRGGCPGGYAQHQGDFALYRQEQMLRQREEMERKALREQQQLINSGTQTN